MSVGSGGGQLANKVKDWNYVFIIQNEPDRVASLFLLFP